MHNILVQVDDQFQRADIVAALQAANITGDFRDPIASYMGGESGEEPLYDFHEVYQQACGSTLSTMLYRIPQALRRGNVNIMDELWLDVEDAQALQAAYLEFLLSFATPELTINGFVKNDPSKIWATVDGQTIILCNNQENNRYYQPVKVGELIDPVRGEQITVLADTEFEIRRQTL